MWQGEGYAAGALKSSGKSTAPGVIDVNYFCRPHCRG
jgi:hypothetical protein